MNKKTITFSEIEKEFISFIEECEKFSVYTRSKNMQIKKVEECKEYLLSIKTYKNQAIEYSDETRANELFHMQCIINAYLSFFNMWISLKNEEFQTAWTNLIDTDEYVSIAIKTKDYEGVRNFKKRIEYIEKSIFPIFPFYNSPGFTETIGKCSICLENFSLCDHIENEVYMGKLCQRVDKQILKVDHVALVKKPRDKRCIMTKLSNDNGEEIDYFTWEKTGKINSAKDGMEIKAVVFKIPNLDVF